LHACVCVCVCVCVYVCVCVCAHVWCKYFDNINIIVYVLMYTFLLNL